MKKATLVAVALLCAAAFTAAPAMAVPFDNKPKILLHVRPITTKNACGTWVTNTLSSCNGAITSHGITPPGGTGFNIYLLVANPDSANGTSIAGFQVGITYQGGLASGDVDGIGLDLFGWTLCATLEFQQPSPPWPKPGGGNLITWDADNNCQRRDYAIAGYFYAAAYGDDRLTLIKRPIDNVVKVADCTAAENLNMVPEDLGYADFNVAGTGGCNPCNELCHGTPTVPTTWGKIKSNYKK